MAEIFVLIEHRKGEIRDISFELLTCAKKIAEKENLNITALLLGSKTDQIIDKIKNYAHKIYLFDDPVFENFNSEIYQKNLVEIIKKESPLLTLIGHTAFGMDLCPALATELNIPFSTDCLNLTFEDKKLKVTRQMFDGKLNTHEILRENPSYILTIRAGSFPAVEGNFNAEIVKRSPKETTEPEYRKFIEYIEAAIGDVDITKSDVVIGIGRGIREQENLKMIEEFAASIGGVVGCSRPIVDADWLPKDRQVGSSGKIVKPKLYIAIGISGAFQHVMGMKNSDTIIAINKDPNAPIFNEADYGIVDDLMKIIPILKEKILEMK